MNTDSDTITRKPDAGLANLSDSELRTLAIALERTITRDGDTSSPDARAMRLRVVREVNRRSAPRPL